MSLNFDRLIDWLEIFINGVLTVIAQLLVRLNLVDGQLAILLGIVGFFILIGFLSGIEIQEDLRNAGRTAGEKFVTIIGNALWLGVVLPIVLIIVTALIYARPIMYEEGIRNSFLVGGVCAIQSLSVAIVWAFTTGKTTLRPLWFLVCLILALVIAVVAFVGYIYVLG